MKAVLLIALASLSCVPMLPPGAAAEDTARQVAVTGVRNKVELSYPGFVRGSSRLNALLPPEPRHIDLLDRILFTRLDPIEQDQFTSDTWATSIKACFAAPTGDMIVTRGAGFKTSLGMCKFYVPAETDVAAGAKIAFNAEPDIVVLRPLARDVSARAP